ncbi:hypothetical protein [Ornithinimicrobium sp. INDO-MA30-4]|uniref:hypothetical protein n=1 Tax=Ornithinimicrobium sp. INDO-MA30-4 TaxID=2908651 RepID=UPI001F30F55B|nr:hypothetical protein [Ornithinimicrobium sp. INDO-MA30-4]UJH69687.1 hypothetical protein L0A91_10180 [Ornithinimicrobium sp. INDO-MA30-4]
MTHRLRRAPGAATLALKQVRKDPGVSLLLAVLVLVMALLATIAPRLLTEMNARQADYSINRLSVTQRDLSSTTPLAFSRYFVDGSGARFPGPEVTWEALSAGLKHIVSDNPSLCARCCSQPGSTSTSAARLLCQTTQRATSPRSRCTIASIRRSKTLSRWSKEIGRPHHPRL